MLVRRKFISELKKLLNSLSDSSASIVEMADRLERFGHMLRDRTMYLTPMNYDVKILDRVAGAFESSSEMLCVYQKELTPKYIKKLIGTKMNGSPFYAMPFFSNDQLSTLDCDVRFLRRIDEVTRLIPNLSVPLSNLNGFESLYRYSAINNAVRRLLDDDEFGERALEIWENKRLNWAGFAQTVIRHGLLSQDFVHEIKDHIDSEESDPFRSLKLIRQHSQFDESESSICFKGKNIVAMVEAPFEIARFQPDTQEDNC